MAIFEVIFIVCLTLIILGLLYPFLRFITAWARRRVNERVVIGHIAAVVRQNLPLAAGIALTAAHERGKPRLHLHRVSRLLAQGLPLSQAMRAGFADCSATTLTLVMAGERAGRLPQALDQAEARLIGPARMPSHFNAMIGPYGLIVLAVMLTVLAFHMVAVVPKIEEIFKDYGADIPPSTRMLIDVAHVIGPAGLLLPLLIVVALTAGMYLTYRPRRVPHPAWTSRVADSIRWVTPGLRRIEFARGLGTALDTIQMGTRAGMDLTEAARLSTDLDVNVHLRARLREFVELMSGGTPAPEAARKAGLGTVTSVALAGGQRSGDLHAALRYAANYYHALLSHWWILACSLAWPVSVLVLSTLIGLVVYALFAPLIALIDVAGNQWYPGR